MEPNEQVTLQEQTTDVSIRGGGNRFFLFKYVSMLASGLVLFALMSMAGYALLDYWLGDKQQSATIFSEFQYYFHIGLAVSLVVFAGLHIWTRILTRNAAQNDQPASSRIFLAIFLAVLLLVITGAVAAMVYVGVNMLLGTGDYSTKSMWLAILDALQVIVWAALLWMCCKWSRGTVVYAALLAVVAAALAVLVVVFPVLSKRDTVIDLRTSSDLSAISTAIGEYAQKNNKLPENLRDIELADTIAGRTGKYTYQPGEAASRNEADDSSEELYRYPSPSSSFSYKLCATFKTDTSKDEEDKNIFGLFSTSGMTKHSAGYYCFDKAAYGATNGGSSQKIFEDLLNSSSSSN